MSGSGSAAWSIPDAVPLSDARLQRWALLAGALVTCVSTLAVLASYRRNKQLRVRPGSLLAWRAAFNFGFAAVVVCNDVGYAVRGDFPDRHCLEEVAAQLVPANTTHGATGLDCVCGGRSQCRLMSFFVQLFMLGSEACYFAISIDLMGTVYRSPFEKDRLGAGLRVLIVVISLFFATKLVMDGNKDAVSSPETRTAWGPSPNLMSHVCWMKRFGVVGRDEWADHDHDPSVITKYFAFGNARGGWQYLYGPLLVFYSCGVLVLCYTQYWLRKGIPKTFKVRQRQLSTGSKLVFTYTVYWTLLFICYRSTMRTSHAILHDQIRPWRRAVQLVFAASLGAKGFCDALVWQVVVVPAAIDRGAAPVRVLSWCHACIPGAATTVPPQSTGAFPDNP